MTHTTTIPSKEERLQAYESYDKFSETLREVRENKATVQISETGDAIELPLRALELLAEILKAMKDGNAVSVVPQAAEVTTAVAADMLGCSRPHLVKLLEEGKIPFTKVGRHRRIKFKDVKEYDEKQRKRQREYLIQMMRDAEEDGLYDS